MLQLMWADLNFHHLVRGTCVKIILGAVFLSISKYPSVVSSVP